MRAITHWVLTTFTSPSGILILAALDSTLFFWLPFGVDAATIVFSMRGRSALVGRRAARHRRIARRRGDHLLDGDKAGDAGLERLAPARYLESARRRIKKTTRSAAPGSLESDPAAVSLHADRSRRRCVWT